MKKKKETFFDEDDPQKLALDLIIGKNRWLIMIRSLFTVFVFMFFLIRNFISPEHGIHFRSILMGLVLSIAGSLIFLWALKRNLNDKKEAPQLDSLEKLAMLQLDFDLVVLSLLVFLSGGFSSPLIVFYIFFIMLSVFLISHEQAFKNTFTAVIFVAVIFFSSETLIHLEGLSIMIGFNVILVFTYLLSVYLARNLKDNELKVQALLNKFKEQSVTDGLTGLYNQVHFFLMLNLHLDRAKRYHTVFSLIMFDLDNFKNYNDHNGHLAGSDALRKVAQLMRKTFRSSDILAKYGGDEFTIILPNSDKVGAFLAADRLRETIEKEPFPGEEHQPLGKVTLSLGIASYPEHGDNTKDIIDRADKALYLAKESGRNRTVIYCEEAEIATSRKLE